MSTTSTATSSATSEQRVAEIRAVIRELAEERDLQGLAAVAGMSLSGLRMLCERPVTCSELGDMVDRLERLNLDELETEEE